MLFGGKEANGPTDVSVSDSVTRDNGNVGLYLWGAIARPMAVEVDHVRSARNTNDGIVAVTDVRGTVTDSITSRNGNDGVIVFGSSESEPVSLGLERVTTTGNTYGLHAHGDATKITASDSTIEYNTTGLFSRKRRPAGLAREQHPDRQRHRRSVYLHHRRRLPSPPATSPPLTADRANGRTVRACTRPSGADTCVRTRRSLAASPEWLKATSGLTNRPNRAAGAHPPCGYGCGYGNRG